MILLFCLVEFIAFLLATLNFRYCAKGHVGKTIFTDVLIAANGFFVIKLVSEATSLYEMAGYVLGAALGSLLGMKLTKELPERK
jgi:uncharacterized membrane protein YfcA